MPTYSYRCSACAHKFDQFQKFSDDPLKDCPTCGGEVRRVIQLVGVVFKGTGWYVTDNRPKEPDAESGSGSSSTTKKSSSDKAATSATGAEKATVSA
jgi:putative FmdB family regulatory protein